MSEEVRRKKRVIRKVPRDEGIKSIVVSYPEQTYKPADYSAMKVGGMSLTVVPREGESAADAVRRTWTLLEGLSDEMFERTLRSFKERHAKLKR